MSAHSNLIEKVLASIAEKRGLKEWRYERKNMPGDVVNYIGNLIPVALIDESGDVTIHLMIKVDSSVLVPEIESIAEVVYKKEVYFYTTMIPLFENNTNISKDFFPKCYYADASKGNRVLALQNMTVKGFERYNKGRFLDKEHLSLSLESVAKFHSLSLILKAKNIKPQDDTLMKPFSMAESPQYANIIQNCFKKYGVDIFEGTQHEDFFENMFVTMTDMRQFIDDCVVNAKTLVYGHGDLWRENFLYKYIDNKPVEVCLLDYQMTHLMSPASDVLFLIMNSTDSDVWRENYRTFVATYYKTLECFLQTNGIDPNDVFSEADFHDDMKLVFPMCFSVIIFSYALWLGFEELSTLENAIGKFDDENNKENVEIFLKIIGDLVIDYENGMFV